MGFIDCEFISGKLIGALRKKGTVTINEVAGRYWRGHTASWAGSRDDDDRKFNTRLACETTILHYLAKGLIEPLNRAQACNYWGPHLFLVVHAGRRDWCDIGMDELSDVRKTAAAISRINQMTSRRFTKALLKVMDATDCLDTEEFWEWFGRIKWKISQTEIDKPGKLVPFEGADL